MMQEITAPHINVHDFFYDNISSRFDDERNIAGIRFTGIDIVTHPDTTVRGRNCRHKPGVCIVGSIVRRYDVREVGSSVCRIKNVVDVRDTI